MDPTLRQPVYRRAYLVYDEYDHDRVYAAFTTLGKAEKFIIDFGNKMYEQGDLDEMVTADNREELIGWLWIADVRLDPEE